MKGVLFDFNGTLVFDSALHEKAWQIFLEKQTGKKVSHQELVEHMHGRPNQMILEYFLEKTISPCEAEYLGEEKESIYRNLCLQGNYQLVEGAVEFFAELKQQEIPFAIASSSPKPNVDFYFATLPLSQWFDSRNFIYNDGSFAGKPAPDIYLIAADKIGADIEECVIFEDSPAGILSALNAKPFQVIGIAPTDQDANALSRQWNIPALCSYCNLTPHTIFSL